MTDITELAARLDRLESTEAARATTWRYAEALDRGDLKAVMETFAPDSELRARGSVFTGRDEIEAYFRDALNDSHRSAHFMANQQVALLAGGEVEVRSAFQFTSAGPARSLLGWGEYLDRVRIADGVGRFTVKEITIHAMGEVAPGWATS